MAGGAQNSGAGAQWWSPAGCRRKCRIFSLLWCGLNKSNTVEAFEALPTNVERLRRNIEMNGMQHHIHINEFALGRTDGVVAFETWPPEQSGWGGIAAGFGQTTIEVAVRRLDSVFKQTIGPVTLKTDCEGADAWVIEGAQELLSGDLVKNVFFELNEDRQINMGIPLDASQAILRKCGFHCSQIGVSDWHAFKA
ncbi:MAG: FkbM family methyltransferase [Verrucomicrobia bacterium]|nr:FkbM family methyltransferase [Verrucomicrobiota bacterium]